MIKAVLFDLDGVIIDSESYYCAKDLKWIHDLGYTNVKIEDLYPAIGKSEEGQVEYFRNLVDNSISFDETHDIMYKYIDKYPMNVKKIVFNDAINLIKYLYKKGYKIALCSSSRKNEILNILKPFNLEKYFNVIISGHDFVETKPNPEIYTKTMEWLDVDPSECIVIEDSTFGIEAGKSSGAFTVAKINKNFNIDQSKADIRVENLMTIVDFLDKI